MILLADFILLSGFALTSVILFMLAVSKKRQTPQNILMLFLSITLVIIITVASHLHGLRNVFIFFNFFEDGARFVLGPLLFIYIKSIFVKDKNLLKTHVLHFVPFILYLSTITIPIAISRLLGRTIVDYLDLLHGTAYVAVVKDIYWLLYIFLSIRLFLVFKTKMKSSYSSFKEANFGWINKFLVSCLLLVIFDLAVVFYRILFITNISWDVGIISLCLLILLTIYLGYHGLRQSTIYLPQFLMERKGDRVDFYKQSPKSNLSKEEQVTIKNKLDAVLTNQKPYLEQELTLNALAELVGTSDKKLSALLNHSLNISFYDFINRYRVEEVKEKLKLKEYEKYSLLGLAYTCGFNSKSSFYRAFKKEAGRSPTEYKRHLKVSQ